MGLVRWGPPEELILQLKDKYALRDFIETGTYLGHTAVWAASYFDNVVTVEKSKIIYEKTLAEYGGISNVEFIFDDSRAALKVIVPKIRHPAIFWLDSHWCGCNTYGENYECPLIQEIRAINISECSHFIFIDDASMFLSPPPLPHRTDQWSSIEEVITALNSGDNKYYTVIIEDVIIAVPWYAKEFVAMYCQELNTKAWEEHAKHLRESITIKQGLRLIGRGLLGYLRRLSI